jgi:hypothetical protein
MGPRGGSELHSPFPMFGDRRNRKKRVSNNKNGTMCNYAFYCFVMCSVEDTGPDRNHREITVANG